MPRSKRASRSSSKVKKQVDKQQTDKRQTDKKEANKKANKKQPIYEVPKEIWQMILEQLVGLNLSKDPHACLFISVPASLCLVSRKWNELFRPFLYKQFSTTCHWKESRKLWYFLRTLVSCPELAQDVRHLCFLTNDIQDLISAPPFVDYIESLKGLYSENQPWLKTAYKNVGWALSANLNSSGSISMAAKDTLYGNFEAKWFAGRAMRASYESDLLREYTAFYHEPLIALIIAHCPNLSRLYIHTGHAASGRNIFISDILASAIDGSAPKKGKTIACQKLELVSLSAQHCVTEAHAEISAEFPWYGLPNLKELLAMDTEISFPDPVASGSAIEKLSLGWYHPGDSELDRLCAITSNLRHLSLTVPSQSADYYGPSLHWTMWAAIGHLKDQLEYLDIFEGDFSLAVPGVDPFPEDNGLHFCPPLQEFTKLKYLSTSVLILLGHQCEHKAPHKLQTHLPPHLVTLGLYTENAAWLNDHVQSLDAELENLVSHGASRGLRAVVLDSSHEGHLPMTRMHKEATRLGLFFRSNAGRYLFFGGSETPFCDISRPNFPKARALHKLREKRAAECIPSGMEVQGFKGMLRSWSKKRAVDLGMGDQIEGMADLTWDEFEHARDFPHLFKARRQKGVRSLAQSARPRLMARKPAGRA